MEKKKNTAKSNKKGTSTNTKKSNTVKKATVEKVTTNKVQPKKVEEVVLEKKVNPNLKPNDNMENEEFAGNEIRKLLIIIGCVCAVMLSFYFITEFVIKNKKDKETNNPENNTTAIIQYEEILMGSMLNQGSGEYYVLAYVKDEPYMSLYNDYIKRYNNIEGHKKVYKVDLSSDFNKSYVAADYFLEGNDITKIKVSGTTLIKVIDNSVSYSYRELDTISDKFERLIG